VRLREAHFQGRAPAVVRRVRGHRRIDARPVHRRRPTSGPVVGASLNTAIFRGWSFLATPPQARLELARIGWPRLLLCQRLAARANDGIDVTVPREVRTALQRNECRTGNRGCYLTPEPVRHGTVVATVYDRRRLADKWKVGERRADRRGSTTRLPFLPSPTRAATVRSVPVPRRLHHRGRCH
jgi:hypothetical protein